MRLPARGARVSVPLGKRVVTGVVTGSLETGHNGETKDLIAVLDDDGFVPAAVVDLAMWVAEYYACGPGDALAAAMPPARPHRTVATARLPAHSPEANGSQPGIT